MILGRLGRMSLYGTELDLPLANKNIDGDTKANPYDLDSDADGITDVKEAQFTDANWDGRVDGSVNGFGWNTTIAGMGSLTLPNTDGTGRSNPYDVDSDDDGIPDNVEGMTTLGYIMWTSTDADADGLNNVYDNYSGFGGDGIHVVDTDGDTVPDYLDSDTDNDGSIDRIEGNDLNFNAFPDDNVTLTGSDTDGDGLDNRFDNTNSSVKGTSAYMGTGGTTSGDPSPGSITVVQRTWIANYMGCETERDWRCVPYILSCNLIDFKAVLYQQTVRLDWTALCKQEVDHFEVLRSTAPNQFTEVASVTGRAVVNESESYNATDNIIQVNVPIIYYRLLSVFRNGRTSLSNIIAVKTDDKSSGVQVLPNPVRDRMQIMVSTNNATIAQYRILDINGKILCQKKQILQAGNTTFTCQETANFPPGLYYLHMNYSDTVSVTRFTIIK